MLDRHTSPERGWPGRADGLSERESEVLVLIAEGLSNLDIARLPEHLAQLGEGPHPVRVPEARRRRACPGGARGPGTQHGAPPVGDAPCGGAERWNRSVAVQHAVDLVLDRVRRRPPPCPSPSPTPGRPCPSRRGRRRRSGCRPLPWLDPSGPRLACSMSHSFVIVLGPSRLPGATPAETACDLRRIPGRIRALRTALRGAVRRRTRRVPTARWTTPRDPGSPRSAPRSRPFPRASRPRAGSSPRRCGASTSPTPPSSRRSLGTSELVADAFAAGPSADPHPRPVGRRRPGDGRGDPRRRRRSDRPRRRPGADGCSSRRPAAPSSSRWPTRWGIRPTGGGVMAWFEIDDPSAPAVGPDSARVSRLTHRAAPAGRHPA